MWTGLLQRRHLWFPLKGGPRQQTGQSPSFGWVCKFKSLRNWDTVSFVLGLGLGFELVVESVFLGLPLPRLGAGIGGVSETGVWLGLRLKEFPGVQGVCKSSIC